MEAGKTSDDDFMGLVPEESMGTNPLFSQGTLRPTTGRKFFQELTDRVKFRRLIAYSGGTLNDHSSPMINCLSDALLPCNR